MAAEIKGGAWLARLTQTQRKSGVPEFGPGDQVRVWTRILERDRTRQVPFEGIVIRRRGGGYSQTVTVRRVTHGEGVERVFPIHAPVMERIEVLRRVKVRRARLYFLRTKVGKTRLADAEAGGTKSAQTGERGAEQPSGSGEAQRAEPQQSASKTA